MYPRKETAARNHEPKSVPNVDRKPPFAQNAFCLSYLTPLKIGHFLLLGKNAWPDPTNLEIPFISIFSCKGVKMVCQSQDLANQCIEYIERMPYPAVSSVSSTAEVPPLASPKQDDSETRIF